MKRLICLTLIFLSGVTLLAFQDEQDQKMTITATLIGVRGAVGAQSVPLTFYIERQSTPEEIQELATILAEQGVDPLRRRMEKLNLGKVNPAGRIGADLATVRVHDLGNGQRIINVSTARTMPSRRR